MAVTLAVTVWTLFLLAFCYRRPCLGIAGRSLTPPSRLAAFAAVLFVVPVTLIVV